MFERWEGRFAKVSGRLKKKFQTDSGPMRTITLCFHKANRTYAGWAPACAGATGKAFCKDATLRYKLKVPLNLQIIVLIAHLIITFLIDTAKQGRFCLTFANLPCLV
ncbi:MAG: hypothetical protein KA006_01470 [Neisseria sp.]|nr:hypothetical protein [Neisseria sp.]MBP7968639.1 hypothetical protein [Neisseria sp.]